MHITNKQKGIIHSLTSRLKLQDEDYRAMVMEHHNGFGSSCLDLNCTEAADLQRSLEFAGIQMGVWTPPQNGKKKKYSDMDGRVGFASGAQLRLIEVLWAGVSYTHDDEKRASALRKFLFRIVAVEAMEFVERGHVNKIVLAMNRMKNQKRNAPAYGTPS